MLAPIAISIAYVSMPQVVIPFKLTFWSFIITIFVIMAAVRLAFVIFGAMPNWSWWRKGTNAWMEIMQLDQLARCLSTNEFGSRLAVRRGRRDSNRPTQEIDTLEV
jgi:hypothetical protein